MATHQTIEALRIAGVRSVRLQFSDLHGVVRGREIPIADFPDIAEDGTGFVEAVMTVDLRHNIVSGFAGGFRDLLARPDLDTLATLPWAPDTAICLCDLEETGTHGPSPLDPRGALRRAIEGYREVDLEPVLGPELEFYLCEPDATSPWGYRRYDNVMSRVYTTDPTADPRRILPRLLRECHELGLGAFAANHEYGRSQFEINLHHGDALDAADRAFRFKGAIKELAALEGLLATFIGKPWNDDEGSGFHLHTSLRRADGSNAFVDADGADGLSPLARQFVAGLIEHGPALMAFLNPTTNAYRRINPEALVPTCCNWGHDNRFVLARVPGERGKACRVELRLGDGAANPYLASAATLFAGLDGIRRELEPPEPLAGLIYELPEEQLGTPLPTTLNEALEALEADAGLVDAMGAELTATFLENKRYELERARMAVTDWEFEEYAQAL
ncbi:MAG: glutamine synthetase [Gaiellales bacterium]|nr:glutamine synthetase [Gaiellales bacterium]